MSLLVTQRALVELIFEKGLIALLHIDIPSIRKAGGLGFPGPVLDKYSGVGALEIPLTTLPIQLNPENLLPAAQLELFEDRVEITLSFDALYRVTIPFAFIDAVIFVLAAEEWENAPKPEPEPAPEPAVPFLSLVR